MENIQKENIYLEDFNQQHFDQISQLLAQIFLEDNFMWKNSNLQREKAVQFFKLKISPCINNKFSFIIKYGDKIVAAQMMLNIIDYLKPIRIAIQSDFLKKLSLMAKELQEETFQKEFTQAQAVNFLYIFVDKNHQQQGLAKFCIVQGISRARKMGFKYGYSRCSNQYSLRYFQKMGCEVLNQKQFAFKTFKQNLSLIKLSFYNNRDQINGSNIQKNKILKQFPKL